VCLSFVLFALSMFGNPLTIRACSNVDFRVRTSYQIGPCRLVFDVCDRGGNLVRVCIGVMHVLLGMSVD